MYTFSVLQCCNNSLRMSSPNAAYKVNNLIRKGYLRKVRSEEDHCEYFPEPTQRHLDYCNVSNMYVDKAMAKVKDRMTEAEWQDFFHVLEILPGEIQVFLHGQGRKQNSYHP